jgi:hypothetical protein
MFLPICPSSGVNIFLMRKFRNKRRRKTRRKQEHNAPTPTHKRLHGAMLNYLRTGGNLPSQSRVKSGKVLPPATTRTLYESSYINLIDMTLLVRGYVTIILKNS